MKLHDSCKASVDACIKSEYFAIAHLYTDDKTMDMHIHNCYEIYYSIQGGKQFLIDNHTYRVEPGDLFFINQYETHSLTQIDSQIHERIVLSIFPEYIKSHCTDTTNLDYCFTPHDTPYCHKVSLSNEERKKFMFFVHKLSTTDGFGADLLEQSTFLELMVFLNKVFTAHCNDDAPENGSIYNEQVDYILSYINQNIQSPLTIEELAAHFHLSASYLCRIFKSSTGTTINKYVTSKRISLAKSFLSQGFTVTESCEKCGFNDYSNFLKAFSKAVGVSPKKYAKFAS